MESLKRWKKNDPISAKRLNDIHRAIPRFATGSDVRHVGTPVGVLFRTDISTPRHKRTFKARILNSTPSTEGPNRWDYQFAEVIKNGPGYDGWALRTNGRTGDAFNYIELPNSDSGVQGNGIDLETLPEGFEVKPAYPSLPNGVVVDMEMVRWAMVDGNNVVDSGLEYWFYGYNPVDGECGGGG